MSDICSIAYDASLFSAFFPCLFKLNLRGLPRDKSCTSALPERSAALPMVRAHVLSNGAIDQKMELNIDPRPHPR